jgi:hypothetical protein
MSRTNQTGIFFQRQASLRFRNQSNTFDRTGSANSGKYVGRKMSSDGQFKGLQQTRGRIDSQCHIFTRNGG